MFPINGQIVYFKEIGIQAYNYVLQFIKDSRKKLLYDTKV